mmetsp:Transcript_7775/g.25754  ORF Transcript_7775/g.25754 Transcript_7775/m.25754 type:complete len:222 (+) Transcript_7775:429-1094(+)
MSHVLFAQLVHIGTFSKHSFLNALDIFAANELCETTRAADDARNAGKSSRVNNQCEMTFVCICTSYPSLGVASNGNAITPAFNTKTSTTPPLCFITFAAASRVDANDVKSHSTPLAPRPTSSTAFSALALGRFSINTVAPRSAHVFAMINPNPVELPVTTTVFPASAPRSSPSTRRATSSYTRDRGLGLEYVNPMTDDGDGDASMLRKSRPRRRRRRRRSV